MKQAKIGDFLIGLAVSGVLDAMIYLVLGAGGVPGPWILVAVIVNLMILLVAIQMKRPFIALGVVATGIGPLLAFGARFMSMVNGTHN